MAVNRVDFGGNTLIDLTGDTLDSAEQLLKGIIAHAKDGSQIVGALEAGGGGGCTITSGSFTPASDPTYGYTVTHGLGKIPEVFVCWLSQKFTGTTTSYFLCGIYSNSLNINKSLSLYSSNVSISSNAFNKITETTIHLVNLNILTTKTYSWIAVA